MTTILWDKDMISKAAQHHKYVFVSSDQKHKKYKLLSGAEKAWYPNHHQPVIPYIYISKLRIMGLEQDVYNELKKTMNDDDIQSYLKNAYTIDHHGDDYWTELKELRIYRQTLI